MCAAILLFVNTAIAARLFKVEYSAYLLSNEGTFIAIARQVAAHPWDLRWWPEWECGLPFQDTYLPLLHLLTGWFSRLTGHSAALSFHQVSAALFAAGPLFFYLLCWRVTRQTGASFIAALAYSVVSASAFVFAPIRMDVGSVWNLRRIQILAYYGEAPHTASMAMLPLAMWCLFELFARQNDRRRFAIFFAGGAAAMAATVLFNAFGAVILLMAGIALILTVEKVRFWKVLCGLIGIGALTYALISPLLPPSTLAAIRMNSPTVDGDFHFTQRSLMGVLALAAGVLLLWRLTRPIPLQVLRFFIFLGFMAGGVVGLGFWARSYVVPQPHRYQIAFDMAAAFVVFFGGAELVRRKAPSLLIPTGVVAIALLGFQFRHVLRYSHGLIRSTDMTRTASYRVAQWLDEHMGKQRVMLPGSYSYQFNDFSDGPQLFGGHDPMLPNFVMRIANFTIYSGFNAGARDAEISILWFKALGVHAVAVPGPGSEEVYKPFVHPQKFDGLLPVLWQEGGDTIYAVPSPSSSLARVISKGAVVQRTPIHGLDVEEVERYVKSLDDPAMPKAALVWPNRHTMDIRTEMHSGELLSIQETYTPGWRVTVNGAQGRLRSDGLGLMILEPACDGRCDIALTYDGGTEWRMTCISSLLAFIAIAGYIVYCFRRPRSQEPVRDDSLT